MAETTLAPAEAGKNTRSVAVSSGPFVVPGFRVGAAASGMRYKDRPDVAIISSEAHDGVLASGVFTTNRFCAAPVELCKEHLKSSRRCRAVVVNAGIANACTGTEGLENARETARLTAEALGVAPSSVLVASTGVIGQQLRMEPMAQILPGLLANLQSNRWEEVARAIMTTDLVPKMASATVEIGGKRVTVGGVAKGSGMIAPNMATMLAFVCTDAAVTPRVLDHWTRRGTDRSFNCITVDGDTSTNDTLLVLASGAAGNVPLADTESNDSLLFGRALEAVLVELARRIVMDGEGATKLIEIHVTGASDETSARAVALTVANSPLVKTAFFGEDANWGRIVAAAGRAGVPLDADRVTLSFDDVGVFRNGMPVSDPAVEEAASRVFKQKELRVHLDLGMGGAAFTAYTCDFSFDYVKINASYRS